MTSDATFHNDMLQALLGTARRNVKDKNMQWFVRGQASGLVCCGKIKFWQQEYVNNVSRAIESGMSA